MAKKIAIGLLIGILAITLSVGLSGCNSIKKTSSTLKETIDSTIKHTSETSNASTNESSSENNSSNRNSSSSSTSGSDDIEITFDTSGNSGYRSCGEKTDSIPNTGKPGTITIGRDKQGNLSINPGGRSINKLKIKTETASNETNFNQSDSSSKQSQKNASEAKAKTLDSLNLIKKLEAKNKSKETKGFNWFKLFCWLIPILVAAYFTAKYLYNKKKLPLSLWLAKALLFV